MYFLKLEIGWAAWGVGALVGLGTAVAAQGGRSIATGAIAAVVSLGAIALGKFAGVHFLTGQALDELRSSGAASLTLSIDDARICLADQLVEEYESKGKALAWPAGMTVEEATEPSHYPSDLWADAESRWRSMTPEEQESYRAGQEAAMRSAMATMGDDVRAEIEAESFKSTFGLMDILFAVLAVATAFQLGRGGEEK